MKSFYRVMLGQQSKYAKECFAGGFIGTDFGIHEDLSGKLPETWQAFNKAYIPVYMQIWPEKSKVAAGLACGAIWTVSKGMNDGDVVLSPDGQGNYRVGEISGLYSYAGGQILPHRRPIHWLEKWIARDSMSDALKGSTGSIGTVSNITKHAEEIENFIGGVTAQQIVALDKDIEDAATFAMEKHLEDFLVQNWSQTVLGKDYDIYKDEGEVVGQQYPSDTGPIDILAVSKDRKTLLVVELKRGRASDVVVGQVLRYMGFVQDSLLEEGQQVRGAIIAMEDDQRLRRALAMVPSVEYYRYEVSFKLMKA